MSPDKQLAHDIIAIIVAIMLILSVVIADLVTHSTEEEREPRELLHRR